MTMEGGYIKIYKKHGKELVEISGNGLVIDV